MDMDNSSPILETLEAILGELKAIREKLEAQPSAQTIYHYYPTPGAAPVQPGFYPQYPQVWCGSNA